MCVRMCTEAQADVQRKSEHWTDTEAILSFSLLSFSTFEV